jgi:hypothetical protein
LYAQPIPVQRHSSVLELPKRSSLSGGRLSIWQQFEGSESGTGMHLSAHSPQMVWVLFLDDLLPAQIVARIELRPIWKHEIVGFQTLDTFWLCGG